MNTNKDNLIDEITDIVEKSSFNGYNYSYAHGLAEELVDRLIKKYKHKNNL